MEDFKTIYTLIEKVKRPLKIIYHYIVAQRPIVLFLCFVFLFWFDLGVHYNN